MDFKGEIALLKDEMIQMRRDFHRRPEPGFQEVETSKVVAKRLEEYGLEVKKGIAKMGVVGLIRGSREGRTVLIRADMDALTVKEHTGLEFASENEGVMEDPRVDAAIGLHLWNHLPIGKVAVRSGCRGDLAVSIVFWI